MRSSLVQLWSSCNPAWSSVVPAWSWRRCRAQPSRVAELGEQKGRADVRPASSCVSRRAELEPPARGDADADASRTNDGSPKKKDRRKSGIGTRAPRRQTVGVGRVAASRAHYQSLTEYCRAQTKRRKAGYRRRRWREEGKKRKRVLVRAREPDEMAMTDRRLSLTYY